MLAESQDEEQIIARVAAIDIGKAELVCCVRIPGPGNTRRRLQEVSTHPTMTRSLSDLANHLVGLGIERVVMEATSDYWKPVFYLLEAHGGEFRWCLQHPEFCGVSSMGRPWSPLSVRLAFWEGLDAGLSVAVAAQAAGVSRPTAYRWLSDHQKVLPSPVSDFSVPRAGLLSLREREEIGFQLAQGHGVRRIAAILGRAPSTISREVARNRVTDRYSPSLAQEQTWARARRPKPRKLDGLALREQVTTMLTGRFSPEQVAGRLKVEHPENPEMQVSHETIYQALYVQGRGSLRLEVATALRSGRVSRRQQRPEGPRPQRFREMVMISDRPAEVDDRAVPGHWESQCFCQAA